MTTDVETARLRRYIIGALADDEAAELEREYFSRGDTLDALSAAEDDLIEEYLAGTLPRAERDHFEQFYLALPAHRERVAIVRRLMAESGAAAAARVSARWATAAARWRWSPVFAGAAALALVAVALVWRLEPSGVVRPGTIEAPPAAAPPASASPSTPIVDAPRVSEPSRGRSGGRPAEPATAVALSLAPVSVRGTSDGPVLMMSPGIARVALSLEADPAAAAAAQGRVVIRTVAGTTVWTGATAGGALPAGIAARVEVPASRLRPDDYFVVLLARAESGQETEIHRYFLRVRAPRAP